MRLTPAVVVGALLSLLAVPGPATAELIAWTYSWSSSPAEVLSDAPGAGQIAFTNEAPHNVVGNTDVVATNLRTVSSATAGNTDKFTNAAYTLSLTIVDSSSGQGGTMTFKGVLNGTVTDASSNITNTFVGETTQSLVLGTNQYTVSIGPYSPAGPPTSIDTGTIAAFAQVNVSSVGAIATVPEPASLLLACLALPSLAISRRRRAAR
jgi:hypothetical protein